MFFVQQEPDVDDDEPCPGCGFIGGAHSNDCQADVLTELETTLMKEPALFDNLAVIAHETISSTGQTVVTGAVGVWPGTSCVGFPPGRCADVHRGDDTAKAALEAALAEYKALMAAGFDHDLTGKDLGGMTLEPGVYHFDSSAELTGTLTLRGPGRFVFLIQSTLVTASHAKVDTVGDCDVTWAAGSSITFGVGSDMFGDFLAQASITVTTAVQIAGSLAALAGAVTLDAARVG